MKYCPKCGKEMDDDAKFCPKCGFVQPDNSDAHIEPQQNLEGMTDPEKFNYLLNNDEKFRDIYTITKRKKFFNFINLLFFIPMLVCLFTPIGVFTGANHDPVRGILAYPEVFSAFTIREYFDLAGKYTLYPNSSSSVGIFPLMLFILSFIMAALFVLTAVLGTPKSYYLKTYLKPNGDAELLKWAKQNTIWIIAVMMCIVSFMAMLSVYINISDLNYQKWYTDHGTIFIFGEISTISGALVGPIVTTIMFTTMIVVGGVLSNSLMTKKLREKYK